MLTAKQKRMKRAVDYLRNYFDTYADQPGYLDYEDQTLIDDTLYGLGAALDKKYQFADGYAEFKDVLRQHMLGSEPSYPVKVSDYVSHHQTDDCAFDRNASHTHDTYVCTCGWQAAPRDQYKD